MLKRLLKAMEREWIKKFAAFERKYRRASLRFSNTEVTGKSSLRGWLD